MKRLFPFAAAGIALAATVAFAQPQISPPPERNLKVFPTDIPQGDLMTAMQGFGSALGVNCSHCHVSGNFASDENPNKDIARGMMRMTWTLNRETLPAIPGLGEPRVTCYTCHRGEAEPAATS